MKTMMQQVAPLLRDKSGRTYRQRGGVSKNEWVYTVWTTHYDLRMKNSIDKATANWRKRIR